MDEQQKPAEGVPTPPPEAPAAEYTPYQATATPAAAGYKDEGWSWGAAMIGPAFLIGTRSYLYLLIYLFMFVPLLNVIAWIGIFFFLGFKGREIARKSTTFANQDEYRGFMKAVDHAGKILFFIGLVFFVLGILAVVTFSAAMFSGLDGGASWEYETDGEYPVPTFDDRYFEEYQ